MPDFVPGQRYPMTLQEGKDVLRAGWPITRGTPDVSRGRRFLNAPGSWEFWTTDGHKVSFDVLPTGGYIVSQSKASDPERPDPL